MRLENAGLWFDHGDVEDSVREPIKVGQIPAILKSPHVDVTVNCEPGPLQTCEESHAAVALHVPEVLHQLRRDRGAAPGEALRGWPPPAEGWGLEGQATLRATLVRQQRRLWLSVIDSWLVLCSWFVVLGSCFLVLRSWFSVTGLMPVDWCF